MFFFTLLGFCFIMKTLKMLNFWFFLHLKGPLMANFSEDSTLTSRKHLFEPGIGIQNSSENLQFL